MAGVGPKSGDEVERAGQHVEDDEADQITDLLPVGDHRGGGGDPTTPSARQLDLVLVDPQTSRRADVCRHRSQPWTTCIAMEIRWATVRSSLARIMAFSVAGSPSTDGEWAIVRTIIISPT
jgi:hypothetical protein